MTLFPLPSKKADLQGARVLPALQIGLHFFSIRCSLLSSLYLIRGQTSPFKRFRHSRHPRTPVTRKNVLNSTENLFKTLDFWRGRFYDSEGAEQREPCPAREKIYSISHLEQWSRPVRPVGRLASVTTSQPLAKSACIAASARIIHKDPRSGFTSRRPSHWLRASSAFIKRIPVRFSPGDDLGASTGGIAPPAHRGEKKVPRRTNHLRTEADGGKATPENLVAALQATKHPPRLLDATSAEYPSISYSS